MPFQHPHVNQQSIDWINKHGTHEHSGVTRLLPIASPAGGLARWRRVGEVLKAIVQYAFDNGEPLRPDGSRWSLSNIGMPANFALSLAVHDVCDQLPASWVTPAYQAQLAQGDMTPMLVSGSTKISRLNRTLDIQALALQTSGASNGQTLAGACATGTHGSALPVGAIHDTVRAVHLMIAPNQAVLLQPTSEPLTANAAGDLTHWLDIPTQLVSDDALFRAALVHLGSLGLVLNIVLETVPLYYLTRTSVPYANRDAGWKEALQRPSLGNVNSHHFEVVLNPYPSLPSPAPRAWAISMDTARFAHQPDVEIRPTVPEAPNPDTIGILSHLLELIDIRLGNPTFRKFITKQLVKLYGDEGKVERALPGVMFGPTATPERRGDSIEFALDAQDALTAVEAILDRLWNELRDGNQFPGVIGVRFVRSSDAWLATNLAETTCYIELPTLRTKEVKGIFAACGEALDSARVPFGCHWGQTHLNTPARVAASARGSGEPHVTSCSTTQRRGRCSRAGFWRIRVWGRTVPTGKRILAYLTNQYKTRKLYGYEGIT